MVEYNAMCIYLEDDGNFSLTMAAGEAKPMPTFGYYVGAVSPDTTCSMSEMGRWVAEEAPYSEFPDSLTRDEIAIIKEQSRVWCNWGPEDG